MALKNGSSATLGVAELTDLVIAFEQENSVKVSVRAYMVEVRGKKDMEWVAEAEGWSEALQVRTCLAYVKQRSGEKRLATMEAVLMHLLYQLDFQLGELELSGAHSKKA